MLELSYAYMGTAYLLLAWYLMVGSNGLESSSSVSAKILPKLVPAGSRKIKEMIEVAKPKKVIHCNQNTCNNYCNLMSLQPCIKIYT